MHAPPTESTDALDVGMICIKNLGMHGGNFTGRWSFNHPVWGEYPEIGLDVSTRTNVLVENNPIYGSSVATKLKGSKINKGNM